MYNEKDVKCILEFVLLNVRGQGITASNHTVHFMLV